MMSYMDGPFTHLLAPLSLSGRGGVHFAGGRAPPHLTDRAGFFGPMRKHCIGLRAEISPLGMDVRSGVPCQAAAARGMVRRPLCRRVHFLAESSGGRETDGRKRKPTSKIRRFLQLGRMVLQFQPFKLKIIGYVALLTGSDV